MSGKSIDIKQLNRNRVYQLIFYNDHISRPEIAARLGLSTPTVMQNVKQLQKEGLVEETGSLDSTGGRKALAHRAVAHARYSIGLDITRSHVTSAVVDLNAKILFTNQYPIMYSEDAHYAKELENIVKDSIEQSAITKNKILGVGISVPGIVSCDNQLVMSELTSYVLQTTHLSCDQLMRYIPYPSSFSNDANAAGMAEIWRMTETGDAVYLSLSDTVGGAVLIDNQVRMGDNQRCGEFGHITLDKNGPHCYCGQKGCVDVYCSAMELSEYTNGNLDAFFDLLRREDLRARAMWMDYLDCLSTTITILRTAFDCDVIIGGYVGAYMEPYIDDLRKLAAQLNTFEEDASYVRVCQFKKNAAAVGAALPHIQAFIDSV